MKQAAENGRPKRARRCKTAQPDLAGGEDGDEDAPEMKPKKRRGKEIDPDAPPPFGECNDRHRMVSILPHNFDQYVKGVGTCLSH